MIFSFPSSWLDYTLVIFGSAVVTATLAPLLPARWGWKAFPIVFATPVFLLAALALVGLAMGSEGGAFTVSSRLFPLSLLGASVAFVGRLVRRRSDPKPDRTF